MQRNISQLNFLQRRSLLISCYEDGSIIIWSLNLISNPKYLFKLRKHMQAISSMVVHPLKEDLIISGSFDKTINFWLDQSSPSSQSQWQCIQTINQHQDLVYGLSINKEGNTLLSCGKDNQILIMQGSRQMEWQIKQKIKLDGEGYRIGFITNRLFAFQSRIPRNRLFLYQLDENTQMFNKLQDVIVEGVGGNQTCAIFFPLVYIDNKQILISKNGQKVNLIKLTFSQSNQLFNQIQTIDYGFQPNGWLFGTVTQDGEYLITWDQKSKNIQIRSYQEKIIKQEQN
ncbi:unnamed protein product [Paramecium pentaurelia]|nr:unnamed protein product [Paramecium pentaurelia]